MTRPVNPDADEMLKALGLFVHSGEVTELRLLGVPGYKNSTQVRSGYFDADHLEELTHELTIGDGDLQQAAGTYITLNPVNPALLSRAKNRVHDQRAKHTSGDDDIVQRRHLLIDLDPERPSGIAATDEEHEAAQEKARAIRKTLAAEDWPEPVVIDSGNGAYLVYAIDLPADDDGLVKRVLEALAARFDDAAVHIDTGVHNPARIFRLPGTMNRKGDDTAERPHRLARVVEAPAALDPVLTELLETLAAQVPATSRPNGRRRSAGPNRNPRRGPTLNVEQWLEEQADRLDELGLKVVGPKDWKGGRKWVFSVCPWDERHTNDSAFLIQFDDGGAMAGCLHDGCAGKGLRDLREVIEPGWETAAQDQAVAEAAETFDRLKAEAAQRPATIVRETLEDDSTMEALARGAAAAADKWQATLLVLRESGVKVKDKDLLEKHVSDRVDRSRDDARRLARDEEEARRVLDELPSAPCGPDTVVPADWSLSESSTERQGDGKPAPIHAPILITARLFGSPESAVLAWLRDGAWCERTVTRHEIAEARTIVKLANEGLPVNSVNAREVVAYLGDYEAANASSLPTGRVSQKLGWQSGGQGTAFLLGHRLLREEKAGSVEDIEPSTLSPDQWPKEVILFQGENEGEEQLAQGFRTSGSLDGWKRLVAPIAHYPKAQLVLSAAFVSPLLKILGLDNFTIDVSGHTSTGKTTALRASASVWGDADPRSATSIVRSWNATGVGHERLFSVMNGLPTFIDDTKQAASPDQVVAKLYEAGNAQGRQRGSLKGSQAVSHFRTVAFVTGEQKATSFSRDGGSRGRVVSIWGLPFGARSDATAKLVEELRTGTCKHYGHAGRAFVAYVLKHRHEWSDWRALHELVAEELRQRAGRSIVGGRLANYAAAITVASEIAHRALGLPGQWADPVGPLWEDLVQENQDADQADEALRASIDWAIATPSRMDGEAENPPSNGWIGRWMVGNPTEYVSFLPDELERRLRDQGFDSQAVIATWDDRGYLVRGNDGRRTKQVRLGRAHRPRMIVIRRKQVEQVVGIEATDPPAPTGPRAVVSSLAPQDDQDTLRLDDLDEVA